MEEKKQKLFVPVIGLMNSGKSTFLNSLLNVKEDILGFETKFACIIRHNKNLKECQFYHVTLEEKNNTAVFSKSGEIIEGINNIIEEIKKINEQAVNEKIFPIYFIYWKLISVLMTYWIIQNFLKNMIYLIFLD